MARANIHGYADRASVAPGERIRFFVSCEEVERYRAEIVRLIHGDTNPSGPGFKEVPVETAASGEYAGRYQPIHAGSHVLVRDDGRLALPGGFTLHAFIWPTTPTSGRQGILSRWSQERQAGYALGLDAAGRLALWLGDGSGQMAEVSTDTPLLAQVWYSVAATYDAASGQVTLAQEPIVNPVNGLLSGAYPLRSAAFVEAKAPAGILADAQVPFVMAGYVAATAGSGVVVAGHYNGKIDRPRVYGRALARAELETLAQGAEPSAEGLAARWDFADGIGPGGIPSDHVTDVSGHGLHGICVQMPTRAVTGFNWAAREENFTHAPEQYGAIHFHDDDLEDAGWEADFELTVPERLKSDVYAAKLSAGEAEEYIPFFVRPPRGAATAPALLLIPTASYLAYANHRGPMDAWPQQPIVANVPKLGDADLYLQEHPELGLSTYDLHSDGSGVCYSSRLRPIVSMHPKYRNPSARLWQFPADLHLVDWLNALGYQYDVATDEDLDQEGLELVRRYRVVLTGTHPEYYSERMLDALDGYVQQGGRLMYLGANGFYWIISYHPTKPHLMEVRKAESGSRAWQARPGEYYHATTGERGGLWRNRGRPPQKLVGVGFTAEGFDVSSPYQRLPDSFDPRAAFIFEGVGADELIGDFGLVGGGAAGHELDRYDLALGTPPNALLLASSEARHSDSYPHVVEEIFFMFPGLGGMQDPAVRADLVYFTTANGGAVFSTGSITWCGSLSHNGYDNNVSRITANVLNRFLQDEPLPPT